MRRSPWPANAARARPRGRAWPRRLPPSTRTRPTDCSRRASRCARWSARSRRCCCRQRRRHSDAGRPSTSSPGATPPGWLSAVKRLSPPATRPSGVLVLDASSTLELDALYAQALELMLRRAGVRTLSLSTGITPNRLARALPALDAEGGRARRPRHLTRRAGPAGLLGPVGRPPDFDLRLPGRSTRHRRKHGFAGSAQPNGGARPAAQPARRARSEPLGRRPAQPLPAINAR